jgi:hypothetical protein
VRDCDAVGARVGRLACHAVFAVIDDSGIVELSDEEIDEIVEMLVRMVDEDEREDEFADFPM